MLFGHCLLSGKKQIVVIVGESAKRFLIKRTYKGVPFGKPIPRHKIKHGVVIHGENVIRNDWFAFKATRNT